MTPLSPAQRRFYFAGRRRPRSEVERLGPWPALCQLRGLNPADREARHRVHESLLLPASLTRWTTRHLNAFLEYVERAWAAAHPGQEPAPVRDRTRENLLHTIRSFGLDEPYIRKLSADLYGLGCYERLALDDLAKLRNTLRCRARAHRHRDPAKPTRRAYALGQARTFTPRATAPAIHQPGLAGFTLTNPEPQPTASYEEDDDMPF